MSATATYCGRCGQLLTDRVTDQDDEHAGCRRALLLEPPRFCSSCRRRMVVQVTPDGWSARCVEHGTQQRSTWAG